MARMSEARGKIMKRKKTFSTMEIVLLSFLVGYLIISFLRTRKEEQEALEERE
jgi:hypothetical protein